MTKHKLTHFITGLAFLLAILISPATAVAVNHNRPTLPEKAGTYNVPGHSELKLRVQVYHAKGGNGGNHGGGGGGKPGGGSSANLTCNLADPDSTTADGQTGWHLPTGTWTYNLSTRGVPSTIGAKGLSSLAANSFDAWSATDVGNSVNFVQGANTKTNRSAFDGQNVITWGAAPNTALAVTYTWYYTDTGVVAEEDTVFNKNFSWHWADQSVNPGCAYDGYYDAQDILTHELGHWMGLNDNYDTSFTDNTMYGYGSPTEVKKNTLATGDINAINSLY